MVNNRLLGDSNIERKREQREDNCQKTNDVFMKQSFLWAFLLFHSIGRVGELAIVWKHE